MKKSEMIEKIYKKSLDDDRFKPEQKKSEKEVVLHVIDYIITQAEDLGMFPPNNHLNKNGYGCGQLDCCEWEPEDEVKE